VRPAIGEMDVLAGICELLVVIIVVALVIFLLAGVYATQAASRRGPEWAASYTMYSMDSKLIASCVSSLYNNAIPESRVLVVRTTATLSER
jgi:hypothetical protein